MMTDSFGIQKSHALTPIDIKARKLIMDLICKKKAEIPSEISDNLSEDQKSTLQEMMHDGLIFSEKNNIKVSETGMKVIRNICSQFDLRLAKNHAKKVLFSKTI